MAYLICRAPRILSRMSSISSVTSTCLRTNKTAAPLIYRALSTSVDSATSEPAIDGSLLPRPIDRSYETPDVTRARLLYQSRKRGILETDLLLSTFAHKHLSTMSESEMREYDRLLDEPDWEIYYWATQKKPIPEEWKDSQILALLKEHVKNEGKVILRMPDLKA